jgi:hypothetical protein
MKHLIGLNDARWQAGAVDPIIINTDLLINGHMLIAGMTGTGKSYQVMQLLAACARNDIEVDIFDPHEELDGAPRSRAVKFSAATRVGYNPLVINTDIHSGGPVNQIHAVVELIDSTSSKLGARQVRALHNLIGDLYHLRGIYPDNPASWVKRQITEREWQALKNAHNYTALRDYYPTLGDLEDYAERKVQQLRLGTTSLCINALNRVMAGASKMQGIQTRFQKAGEADGQRLSDQLEREKLKAIEAYTEFVQAIETGRELPDANKYTDAETLEGVLDRIRTLRALGIFNSNPPQFGDALIRDHQIGALNEEFQRMLVFNRAAQIFRECQDAGKSHTLRRVILVDEGSRFYSENAANPLNRIAKEGRKFGLGLVVASQSPTHFSEDFLTSCGTIMLLAIHEKFWKMAASQLNIDLDTLKSVRPKEVLALKMHVAGEMAPRFAMVNVNAQAVAEGMRLLRAKLEEKQRIGAH